VVVARPAARTASNDTVRQAYERLLRRLGALPMPGPDGTMPPPGVVAPSQSEPAPDAGPAEPAR
jgi:ribonuclease P protein component